MPNLEVHGLARANAQQDSQHFQIGDLLCQRRVKAGATLLDEAKVEARSIGNRLKVGWDSAVRVQDQVIIIDWNGGGFPPCAIPGCLLKCAAPSPGSLVASV